MFTRFLTVASLAAATFAAPTARSGSIIEVFVGGEGILAFTPSSVTANPGDVVRFTFGQKNHTVTQSTFAAPCTEMAGGFFSGYMPVAAGVTDNLPQYEISVKDTTPIWAFCSQTGHCGQGMVFAVNAPADPDPKSFTNYKNAALATGASTAAPAAAAPVATASTAAADPAATTPALSSPNAAAGADPYNYGSPTGSSSVSANAAAATGVTATGSGTTHQVVVGGTGVLTFSPDQITAAEGDTVQFVFHSKNHTATQSSFKSPCSPLAAGFDSGFTPSNDTGPFPTYSYTVTNASVPVWVYCKQANHCQQGMVFAINTNESSPNTFAAFQAAAKASTSSPSTSASSSSSAASATVTANSASSVLANGKAMAVVLSVVSAAFALVL